MQRLKTTLYIARHGETEFNVQGRWQGHIDSALTENGIEQAKNLAEELREIQFDAIFASDLLRAKRTAEIAKLERDLEVKTTELLRERHMGNYEGRTTDEIKRDQKELFEKFQSLASHERPDFRFDGSIESNQDLMTRFLTILRESSLAYPAGNILVVSHGGAIRSFLGHLDPKYYGYKVGNTGYAKVLCDGVNFEIVETKRVAEPTT
jgi:broad specificity phosphatase PhoE